MSEWEFVAYESLAAPEKSAFSMGPFGSKLTQRDYRDSGVPLTRGINLTKGIFHDSDFVYISPEKADELPSANVRPGDLVFTHRGTIGQVSMIPRNPRFRRYVICSSQVKTRLDQSKAIPEFYYYWFQSPKGQHSILENSSTVGVPGIATPLTSIRKLQVPRPPLVTQKAIAAILGALDDKIAVNDRIAATSRQILETLSQSITTRKSRQVELREIVELHYGKALKTSDRTPGKVPIFGGNGISGSHNRPLVSGPGIIIGRKGANAGSVSWSNCDFWPIDTAFYVTPKRSTLPMEFLFLLLQKTPLRDEVGDSAIPGLNRDIALSTKVWIPEVEAAIELAQQARPHFKLQDQMEEENRTLAELRDTLLPKLMSGRVRIRDAEKVVEDAV
ncbi:restriction endonuclease subunit S [Actinomadura sp. SCN-SB]|uniref:restriction endonuclease subunit S n=1 Tax=Actinomadura sp. SCN-SB TaxID=3373092 RepID=UPI00374FF3F5